MRDAALCPREAAALKWFNLRHIGKKNAKVYLKSHLCVRLSPEATKALRILNAQKTPGDQRVFGLTAVAIASRIRAACTAGGLKGCTGLSPRHGKLLDLADQGWPAKDVAIGGRLTVGAARRLYFSG